MLAKILIELFKTRQGTTVKSAAIQRQSVSLVSMTRRSDDIEMTSSRTKDCADGNTGYLAFTPEEHEMAKDRFPSIPKTARVLFEYGAGKEGCWTRVKFMS